MNITPKLPKPDKVPGFALGHIYYLKGTRSLYIGIHVGIKSRLVNLKTGVLMSADSCWGVTKNPEDYQDVTDQYTLTRNPE